MSKSRVVNSAVNTIFNFSVKLFDFGIKFVLRTVFIYTLGMQYVGVSGLFTDILSVLSFVELGIGSAITYALYKPLAENDEEKLGKLMHFYKWAYRIVALVILICGLLVVPFLSKIVTNVPDIKESITIIYILYLSIYRFDKLQLIYTIFLEYATVLLYFWKYLRSKKEPADCFHSPAGSESTYI